MTEKEMQSVKSESIIHEHSISSVPPQTEGVEAYIPPEKAPESLKQLAIPVAKQYSYHIFGYIVQPGNTAMLAGIYQFPFIIAVETYADMRLLIANHHKLQVDQVMITNFIMLS